MNDTFPLRLETSFLDLLQRVNADAALERDWIDLLSQLEYVGCRKIMKAIPFNEVNTEILQHISEEASHAFLLKHVIDPSGTAGATWGEGRFSSAGWRYFQRLDHGVSALEASANFRYPGVAWAIERRVLGVYPVLLEITKNDSLRRALKTIMGQEKRHGALFAATEFPEGFQSQVIQLEEILWREFEADLTKAI